jgi:hypothetical protein
VKRRKLKDLKNLKRKLVSVIILNDLFPKRKDILLVIIMTDMILMKISIIAMSNKNLDTMIEEVLLRKLSILTLIMNQRDMVTRIEVAIKTSLTTMTIEKLLLTTIKVQEAIETNMRCHTTSLDKVLLQVNIRDQEEMVLLQIPIRDQEEMVLLQININNDQEEMGHLQIRIRDQEVMGNLQILIKDQKVIRDQESSLVTRTLTEMIDLVSLLAIAISELISSEISLWKKILSATKTMILRWKGCIRGSKSNSKRIVT